LRPLPAAAGPRDLTELSLDELMNVKVTLVSRKAEPRAEVPAAVAVVTPAEIRRSGVTSFANALRLVPG
jgi:iron complex outermembrane receptor protein